MFLDQLLSVVKQNQCSAELFLTLNRNAPYTHEAFVLFFFFLTCWKMATQVTRSIDCVDCQ